MFNGEIKNQAIKEVLQKVVNICKNEEDYQDGTVNTQCEPLHFGIANGCAYIRGEVKNLAKDYGVEVDEWPNKNTTFTQVEQPKSPKGLNTV